MVHEELKKRWKFIVFLVGAVLVSIFIIKPAVLGYSVYQNLQKTNASVEQYGQALDDLEETLRLAQLNATVYAQFNQQLLAQVDRLTADLNLKSSELSRLDTKLQESEARQEEQLQQLRDELAVKEQEALQKVAQKEAQLQNLTATYTALLDEKSKEMQQLNDLFGAFIASTARSICCKEKVDDPSIDAYEIVNNRVMCLQEGNRTLAC